MSTIAFASQIMQIEMRQTRRKSEKRTDEMNTMNIYRKGK